MEMFLLITQQIASMFIMIAVGIILVKADVLEKDAFVVAIIFNLLLIIVPQILKKRLKLSVVEQASLSYPNSGEILIPLVVSVLPKELT